MERFILFAEREDYPSGGMDDLIGFFPTVEDARARYHAPRYGAWDESGSSFEWGQIVDRETMKIVERL